MERLLKLLAIQLGVQLWIQVEVKLEIQVQTHVPTQVSTRVRIPLPILPGILLRILLDAHQRDLFQFTRREAALDAAMVRDDEVRLDRVGVDLGAVIG